MDTPLLSIIVPVYNVESYLDNCVQSILSQTMSDWEMILVDDGSPDRCPAMCDTYAATDNRIRVIHQQNRGLSAARNTGIRAATAKYITFVDSDDDVTPETFELNIIYFHQYQDLDVVQYPQIHVDWGFVEKIPEPQFFVGKEDIIENTYRRFPINHSVCNKIFKRELFDSVLFREGHAHEDKYFIVQALQRINKICVSPHGCYHYNKREGSIQNVESFSKASDWIDTELEMMQWLFQFPSLREEWTNRWMAQIRWLMNNKLANQAWDVLPLLERMRTVMPQRALPCKTKNFLWFHLIRTFGIRLFHNIYLFLLRKHHPRS